jgi:hypothetical protein
MAAMWGATAAFAWKDGQTTLLSDFIPDMFAGVPHLDLLGMTDVGLVVRKNVKNYGIYRNGVFIDARASGISVSSGVYACLQRYNKKGQMLFQIQTPLLRYQVVVSPR